MTNKMSIGNLLSEYEEIPNLPTCEAVDPFHHDEDATKSPKVVLRTILPKTFPQLVSTRTRNRVPVPRRVSVIAACESCRQRKAKCDALRPVCSGCLKADKLCTYTTNPAESRRSALIREHDQLKREIMELRQARDIFNDLFIALQTRPEADAMAILLRIRRGEVLKSVQQHVRDSDTLLQLQLTPEMDKY